MERVNKEEATGKPRWKKIGGGSLRIGKQIIKPGQTFEADPEEISPSFRNMVIPVSEDATFQPIKEKDKGKEPVFQGNAVKPVYTMQPHGKSLFLFDIVDAQGKVLNEKSLKKDVAEKLIEDLQK